MSDDEMPGGTVFIQQPSSSSSKSKDLRDVPVENAEEIPLFLDSDKRGTKSAAYLRINKRDEPHSGYKGQVPLSTTIDSIARLFGNGYFDIELCNHKHQVLRIKENVKIDVPVGASTDLAVTSSQKSGEQQVLKDLISSHEKEIERLTKTLTYGSAQAERQSKEHVDLIKTTTKEASERERLFMQGQQKQQQDFFSSMMLQSQQMFQQTMVLLSAGHRMTIESLQAVLGNQNKSSDVDTLLKGIAVAKELGGDDDEPWVKAMSHGSDMLSKLVSLKSDNSDKTAKNPNNSDNKPKKKIPLTRNEVLEIIRLKEVLHSKDIDLTELVRDARNTLENADSNDESSEDSEDNSPEDSK